MDITSGLRKMRRYVASLTLTAMAMSMLVIGSAQAAMSFTDVDLVEHSWFYNELDELVDAGVFDDGTQFRPGDDMNRAELAAVIQRAAGFEDDTSLGPSFPDVNSGVWYYEEIETLFANDVVSGYANGNFGPADDVTRGQATKFYGNAFAIEGSDCDVPFTDIAGTGDLQDFIEVAYCNSLVNGKSATTFDPNATLKRSEMAVMAWRALNDLGPREDDDGEDDDDDDGEVPADEFGVVSATPGPGELEVKFSMAVDATTGADVVNYAITETDDTSVVLPVTAAVVSDDMVTLTTGVQAENRDYTVTVTGVTAVAAEGEEAKTLMDNSATFKGYSLLGVGGSLTVALAADTPASSNVLIQNQAIGDLAHFLFTNNGESDTVVTGLQVTRIGQSDDTTAQNVYLFNNGVRITDAATVSQNVVTFNDSSGLFTIAGNGGTKNIVARVDIANTTSGQKIGFSITSAVAVTSNATSVDGTFPVDGNILDIAAATLSGADFTGTTLPAVASVDPQTDALLWQRTLSISTRDVWLQRMAFREIGSVNYSDISNFRLYVDGVMVGAAIPALDGDGYVTFTFTDANKLKTGSRVIKLLGDVVGGSSRTYSFSLRNVADIELVDDSYSVPIRPTVVSATFTSITSGVQTVNSGTVTIQKAVTSPSGNTINSGSDVVLGSYDVTAYGEAVKIETLTAAVTYTGRQRATVTINAVPEASDVVTINGVAVTFVDGAPANNQVQRNSGTPTATTIATGLATAINASSTAGLTALSATSSGAIVTILQDAAGGTTFALVDTTDTGVDSQTISGATSALQNVAATLRNGKLMVIEEGLSARQIGSTATLGSATPTAYTTNLTVNPGKPVVVEIRADVFDNDGTGVFISDETLRVQLNTGSSNGQGQVSLTTSNVPSGNQLANIMTIQTGTVTLAKVNSYTDRTVVVPQTAYKIGSYTLTGNSTEAVNLNTLTLDVASSGGFIGQVTDVYIMYGTKKSSVKATVSATGNTWSISEVLPQNGNLSFDIYASIGSTLTGTVICTLTASGTTVGSGQTAASTAVAGQTITQGTGSIASILDPGSPAANIVTGSTTADVAKFKFDAVNDSYTINEVVLAISNSTAVQTVSLLDGTTVLQTKPFSGTSVTFSGLTVTVPANDKKVLTVQLALGPIGVNLGSSGANVTITLSSYKAKNSQGTESTTSPAQVANAYYVYKVIPTISNVALPTTQLALGDNYLAKFAVTPSVAQSLSWKQITFTVTKTANPTIASSGIQMRDETKSITIPGVGISSGITGSGTSGTITFIPTVEQVISAANTYSLIATVGGSVVASAGDSISTKIANPSTAFAASAVNTNLVWPRTTGPTTNTADSYNYSDVDGTLTVTANDIRKEAVDSFTSAVSGVSGITAGIGNGKVDRAFGVTTGRTIIVNLTNATPAVLGAFTGTFVSTDSAVCLAYQTDGTTATTVVAAIRYIECIVGGSTPTARVRIQLSNTGNTAYETLAAPNATAGLIMTFTITRATGTYTLGSVVAADAFATVQSDTNTALTLPSPSFVWSDNSALTHDSFPDTQTTAPSGTNSLDWNNDFKVKNFPTDSQTLSKSGT